MVIGPVLLVLMLFTIGILFLQVYLSKRENKWFGLILPILTFTIALCYVVSIASYFSRTMGITTHFHSENGVIVEERITGESIEAPAFVEMIMQLVITFVLFNIPTIILFVIYAVCREKRKKQLELEKMKIQDLE